VFGSDLLGVGCMCWWVVCVVSSRVANIVVVVYTCNLVCSLVFGCGNLCYMVISNTIPICFCVGMVCIAVCNFGNVFYFGGSVLGGVLFLRVILWVVVVWVRDVVEWFDVVVVWFGGVFALSSGVVVVEVDFGVSVVVVMWMVMLVGLYVVGVGVVVSVYWVG
jgi:hypothetical protein